MKKTIVIAMACMALSANAAPKNAIVKDLTVKRDATFQGGINVEGATEGQVLVSDADGNFTAQTLTEDGTVNPFTTVTEGIYTNSNVGIGVNNPVAELTVGGLTLTESFRVTNSSTPTGSEVCANGTFTWDTNFVYICAGNTFKRAALSAF